MKSEAAQNADFSQVRYAQVWEDADILMEALAIREGDICLSIASAGDNALSMLAANPARVIALDLNPAQLACLELRVAAMRTLPRHDFLVLLGAVSAKAADRVTLYRSCRDHLSERVRAFWDARLSAIKLGMGRAGKFERYFHIFRTCVLPLVHSRQTVRLLLEPRTPAEREAFYEEVWNTWRWKLLFRAFFSRFVMGRLGRDPSFFRYVEGSVAERILARTRHALTVLEPDENPYLQWILLGTYATALPFYLREENYSRIQANLDRIEWHEMSVEAFVEHSPDVRIAAFNLSDIFEYMSEENHQNLMRRLLSVAAPGARFAYWNMLAPRMHPEAMADVLDSLEDEAALLHARDKAFFYSRFVLERNNATA